MSNPPKDLLDLLKRYNSDVQELALALREVVLDELAPCHENIIEVYMTIQTSRCPPSRL